jgi:hypothetical protein
MFNINKFFCFIGVLQKCAIANKFNISVDMGFIGVKAFALAKL